MRRDVTIRGLTATARASASLDLQIALQTRLMLHWSDIAIEQEAASHLARRGLEATMTKKAAGDGLEIDRELKPAMVAIAATAHALDALYGEVHELALPPNILAAWQDRRARPPRPRQINEALKHGFDVGRANRFEAKLDKLFSELRDPAVHPATSFNPPTPHPLGVRVAQEYDLYRCETATEAVDLLMEVLETCAANPKPALKAWSDDLRPSFDRLIAKRADQKRH